jgi:hypothetical protein
MSFKSRLPRDGSCFLPLQYLLCSEDLVPFTYLAELHSGERLIDTTFGSGCNLARHSALLLTPLHCHPLGIG